MWYFCLSCVTSLTSVGFTYFCYSGIDLSLPLFDVFPPPFLNGFSLYFSILYSSHLGPPEKLVVDCWIVNLLSESATLFHLLFLLVLPHPCLPIHAALIITITSFYKAAVRSVLLHRAVLCCRDDCIPHSLLSLWQVA